MARTRHSYPETPFVIRQQQMSWQWESHEMIPGSHEWKMSVRGRLGKGKRVRPNSDSNKIFGLRDDEIVMDYDHCWGGACSSRERKIDPTGAKDIRGRWIFCRETGCNGPSHQAKISTFSIVCNVLNRHLRARRAKIKVS